MSPKHSNKDVSRKSAGISEAASEFYSSSKNIVDIKGSKGIGIAFSGGGFRATLFHCGVIRALRDRGELGNIRTITSVSGGSIAAAHLVLNWERYLGSDQEFAEAENRLLSFIQSNPRADIVAHLPLAIVSGFICGLLRKLDFERLEKLAVGLESTILPTCTLRLSRLYANQLYLNPRILKLSDLNKRVEKKGLPPRPYLNILACNLTRMGDNSFFSSKGFHANGTSVVAPCDSLRVSHAVAASSAFPFLFEPWLVSPSALKVQNNLLSPTLQALTDGGAFDNLGVHRLLQIANSKEYQKQPLRALIVSDAGGAMDWDVRSRFSWIIPRLKRVSEILYRQSIELQKQRFESIDNGIVIGLSQTTKEKLHLGTHAQDSLEKIRTDLDSFSEFEISSLINHGYVCTQEKIKEKWTLFPSAWQLDNRRNELPYKNIESDQSKQRKKLDAGSVKRPHIAETLKHKICLFYGVLLLGIIVISGWRYWNSPYRVESSTIRQFLIRTERNQTTPFASELSNSSENLYFVGLVNQYTLENYKEIMSRTIKESSVDINFYLYLPEVDEVGDSDVEFYVDNFRRYRPHGDNYAPSLRKFWKGLDENENLMGGSSSPPKEEMTTELLKQFFYHETPKGWLVVFDADEDFETARAIYWYPYLAKASDLDRPGFSVHANSDLGKALLQWLKDLTKSQGTRLISGPEIDKWKNKIFTYLDNHKVTESKPAEKPKALWPWLLGALLLFIGVAITTLVLVRRYGSSPKNAT